MNPLARLRQMRKANDLYESLVKGETDLLVEHFPFIQSAFSVILTKTVEVPVEVPVEVRVEVPVEVRVEVPVPVPQKPRKPLPPPKVTQRARSEQDDLRDALDIGFGQLKFEPLENEDSQN